MRKLGWFVGIVIVLVILFNSFTFTVDETKQGIVLQYGDIVKVATEPGLYFKIPFIQNVQVMEDRLLSYDIQPRKLITSDKRRLLVNNYAIWKINDPTKFRQALNARLETAQTRIDDIVYSNLRNTFAEFPFNEIASEKRIEMLENITQDSDKKLDEYGVHLIDVRVKRADLPEANEEAVYDRMKSERQREAAELRAEGEETARELRSEADRESRVIVAEAKREGESIRGEGEATALQIYSKAYRQDPEFYEFWRTLQSYKKSFQEGSSTILLSPNSQYMTLFKNGSAEMAASSEKDREGESTSSENSNSES